MAATTSGAEEAGTEAGAADRGPEATPETTEEGRTKDGKDPARAIPIARSRKKERPKSVQKAVTLRTQGRKLRNREKLKEM